jgi:hypothetical protein
MTNDTLLLRLRAETLQANLFRLKCHLATPDRMADLGTLAETTEAARKAVGRADRSRMAFRDKIDQGEVIAWKETIQLGEDGTVETVFEEMKEELDRARKSLLALQTTIDQMKIKCFRVAETPVGSDIVEGLHAKMSPLIAELRKIQAVDNDPDNLAGGWEALRKKSSATEPIFTDYMELLGAAALRDTGFDEKISFFADELLRSTGRKLLALPTRRQALATTFTQIIRVTFPDWTLWALPSVALEFWKVVVGQQVEAVLEANLQSLSAGERALIKPEYKPCLGDAYATYTMGPAYAYYAVGLSLEIESEPDQSRVRAILAMLEEMEESRIGTRYRDVRSQLLNAWNAARAQWKQPPLDWILDDREAGDAEAKGMRAYIRGFRKTLETETSAKFGTAIWDTSQPWVTLLVEDKADQINVPNGAELRHLLNAAWLARVDANRDDANDLNAAVRKLQDKVKERQDRKGK